MLDEIIAEEEVKIRESKDDDLEGGASKKPARPSSQELHDSDFIMPSD
jgi:hypothetical protein